MFKLWLCIFSCLLLVTLAEDQAQEDDKKIICDDGKVRDVTAFVVSSTCNYVMLSTDALYRRIFSIV